MEIKKITAKEIKAANGVLALLIIIVGVVLSVALVIIGGVGLETADDSSVVLWGACLVAGIVLLVLFCIMPAGLKTVQPNEAKVFTLFGKYYGTISRSGFFFINPFCQAVVPVSDKENAAGATLKSKTTSKDESLSLTIGAGRRSVSLKTQTLNNDKQKVNDVLGNPIVIGAIVIWRVADPTQAVFAVENYKEYLSIQTDSIVRNTARLYPYDIFDDDDDDENNEKSLRGSSLEIADNMKKELQDRVRDAGLEIEEVRITHLAYSEEIAAAMLQRQQAAAIIAARQKIVDGAVGMVKMAIDKLSEDNVVVLDDERKATMVSNLLVVLCGNKDAQPVVNSGSIY